MNSFVPFIWNIWGRFVSRGGVIQRELEAASSHQKRNRQQSTSTHLFHFTTTRTFSLSFRCFQQFPPPRVTRIIYSQTNHTVCWVGAIAGNISLVKIHSASPPHLSTPPLHRSRSLSNTQGTDSRSGRTDGWSGR